MPSYPRRPPIAILLAVALLAAGATAGLALAKSFTLKVAKNVHVTNNPTKAFRVKAVNTHEAIAVGPTGYAVYTFQGETTHHIICRKTSSAKTNCWAFWPPVTPSSKSVSKASGVKGKLGTFRNHGVLQLTLERAAALLLHARHLLPQQGPGDRRRAEDVRLDLAHRQGERPRAEGVGQLAAADADEHLDGHEHHLDDALQLGLGRLS